MTSVNYDVQMLNEAVALLVGEGSIRDRLAQAHRPLSLLLHAPFKTITRDAELTRICESLNEEKASQLSDEEAISLAGAIKDLQVGLYEDMLSSLKSQLQK